MSSELFQFIFHFQRTGQFVGSWHELMKSNTVFASCVERMCLEAKVKHGIELAAALGFESKDGVIDVMDTTYQQPAILCFK